MTLFSHTTEHELDCDCSYCHDVDPNKSISRELERCIEELTQYAFDNFNSEQSREIDLIATKILLLRRYFPTQELPSKHKRLVEDAIKDR